MKIWYNLVGCLAVFLGILGIFLPLLPTTPFLLLASACFARGSTRLHGWLQNNRVFGAYLRDFEAGRGIPLRGKIIAITVLWLSMAYSISRLSSIALQLLLVVIGVAVTVYLVGFVPLRRLR